MSEAKAQLNYPAIAQLTTAVMRDIYGDKAPFDPATWMFIFDFIMKLIENCEASARRATKTANKPGPFGKIALTFKVKNDMGRRAFRENGGREIVKAMLKTGKGIKVDQMEAMYAEVG